MSSTKPSCFLDWQKDCQQKLLTFLDNHLPKQHSKSQLLEAMRYSALAPGKRLRPCLIYTSSELLGISPSVADRLAAVVEIVHVYSLIHDDLPAMDDDDLRRGRPSCHKAYDEATAILAGDALQVLAFEWLCELEIEPVLIVQLCATLSKAIGASGMAHGQALDMYWTDTSLDTPVLEDVKEVHRLKTGKLFSVCVEMCLIVSQNKPLSIILKKFAHHLGIAFQIQDDILDIIGTQELIGKQVGSDLEANKLTYPSLIGLDESYVQCTSHYNQAIESLKLVSRMQHTMSEESTDINTDSELLVKRLFDLAQHIITVINHKQP